MNGSRRITLVGLLLILAGCDATPVLSPARSSEPVATVRPISSTQPSPAPSAARSASPAPTSSNSPTSIDLPPGFDTIAWSFVPDGDGNEDEFTVTIGVLGKPATATRTYQQQPTVFTSGSTVLIDTGQTEVIDATTGRTIATFNRSDLDLPRVPANDFSYGMATRFRVDVARGYLYLMSGNRDRLQLRRFTLDGSHEARLAIVAPDPGADFWYSDFVITPDGTVVATSCPPVDGGGSIQRCRLYEIKPGEARASKPRLLPLSSPRPCALIASDGSHLFASSLRYCRADGGPPQVSPYMDLDLRNLTSRVGHATSHLTGVGVASDEMGPFLIANMSSSYPVPSPYRAAAVRLRLDGDFSALDPVGPFDEDAAGPLGYGGYVWGIQAWAPDWTLWHGFGPDYAACAADPMDQAARSCPSGPVLLETTEGTFELPTGTWGNNVPPHETIGF